MLKCGAGPTPHRRAPPQKGLRSFGLSMPEEVDWKKKSTGCQKKSTRSDCLPRKVRGVQPVSICLRVAGRTKTAAGTPHARSCTNAAPAATAATRSCSARDLVSRRAGTTGARPMLTTRNWRVTLTSMRGCGERARESGFVVRSATSCVSHSTDGDCSFLDSPPRKLRRARIFEILKSPRKW